jgi:hypothetical protein
MTYVTYSMGHFFGGTLAGRLYVWSWDKFDSDLEVDAHPDAITSILVKDGTIFTVSASQVKLWTMKKDCPLEHIKSLSRRRANILDVQECPSSGDVVYLHKDKITCASSNSILFRLPRKCTTGGPTTFAITKTLTVIVGTEDGTISIINDKKQHTMSRGGADEPITCVCPVPDSQDVIIANHFGDISLVDTARCKFKWSNYLPDRYARDIICHSKHEALVLTQGFTMYCVDVAKGTLAKINIGPYQPTTMTVNIAADIVCMASADIQAPVLVFGTSPLVESALGGIKFSIQENEKENSAADAGTEYEQETHTTHKQVPACVVCMETQAQVAFSCGHLCICTKCYSTLEAVKHLNEKKTINCPLCRQTSSKEIRIYL